MNPAVRRALIRGWLDARTTGAAHTPIAREAELRAFTPGDLDAVTFRRRRLPHWELADSTYFVTFRLARHGWRPFTVPPSNSLAGNRLPPFGLGEFVEEAIFFGLHTQYELDSYVVMPNHVHLLITPLHASLAEVTRAIKGYSSHAVNRALGRRGPLWQPESFDHLVRSEADWLDKRAYIHANPVAAGLAAAAEAYPLGSAATLEADGRREELCSSLNC